MEEIIKQKIELELKMRELANKWLAINHQKICEKIIKLDEKINLENITRFEISMNSLSAFDKDDKELWCLDKRIENASSENYFRTKYDNNEDVCMVMDELFSSYETFPKDSWVEQSRLQYFAIYFYEISDIIKEQIKEFYDSG